MKVDLAVSFNNNWYNDKVNDIIIIIIIKQTKISHNLSKETIIYRYNVGINFNDNNGNMKLHIRVIVIFTFHSVLFNLITLTSLFSFIIFVIIHMTNSASFFKCIYLLESFLSYLVDFRSNFKWRWKEKIIKKWSI